MAGILDYYLSRGRPNIAVSSGAPPVPQAETPRGEGFGQALTQGLNAYAQASQRNKASELAAKQAEQQYGLQNRAMTLQEKQYQGTLDAQDAALAQKQQQIENARQVMFDQVASGQLDPAYLDQFDASVGDQKLAIAQQALDPTGGVDPTVEAELAAKEEIERRKIDAQRAQHGDTFNLARDQLDFDRSKFANEQDLSLETLAQEKALAEAEMALKADLAGDANAIKQQAATPEILQLVEAAGLEPTPDNVRLMAEAQADRTMNAPKPPSGYQFVDPANPNAGVLPTPGGPADPANPKNFTGEQKKAATTVGRLESANANLMALEAGGFNPADPVEAARANLPFIGGYTQSDAKKEYETQASEWSETYLRKMSGGQVTDTEIADARKTYFPTQGDGDEQIAQKAQLRQNIQNEFMNEAGAAYKRPEDKEPKKNNEGGFNRETSSGVRFRVIQ